MPLPQMPPMNAPTEMTPFLRYLSDQLAELQTIVNNGLLDNSNVNKAQNSTTTQLSQSLADLSDAVTKAISTVSISASQVTSGTFALARIPTIPTSQVSGTWTNDVSSVNVTGTNVFASNAGVIAGNITAARTSTWARNSDGYIGNTLSSERFKQLVAGIDPPDPLKILEWTNEYYYYLAELDIRDNPENPDYNPDYHVQLEWGPMAERLHELGLWQAVVYEDHVTPISVQHPLFGQFAIEAAKYVWTQHQQLRADFDELAASIGFTPSTR